MVFLKINKLFKTENTFLLIPSPNWNVFRNWDSDLIWGNFSQAKLVFLKDWFSKDSSFEQPAIKKKRVMAYSKDVSSYRLLIKYKRYRLVTCQKNKFKAKFVIPLN
jgi:hypothetical protein